MHWYDWAVLSLAAIGHIVLIRAAFNYTFLIHLSEGVWLSLVALTALIALAGPAIIFWFPGAQLIRNQSWSTLHPLWIAYLSLCAAATLIGLFTLLWRRYHQIPPAQVANHTERLDVCATVGHSPRGHGHRAWVANLPWNELFDVEFTEKRLRLPRLPAAWDGLSILHLTDIHFHGTPELSFYECVFDKCRKWNPDLIALTGDILDDTKMADWLPTTLGQLHAPLGRYFILGNHDTRTDAETTRQLMTNLGWTNLGSRAITTEIRDERMLLAGVERPWIGHYPHLQTPESEISNLKSRIPPPSSFRLLLTHGPHVFSWARKHNFDLTLAGHLHGGQIRLPFLGPITGGKYHAGTFQSNDSIMHVGRGLGQLTPIRYRCRPEVTKLILTR